MEKLTPSENGEALPEAILNSTRVVLPGSCPKNLEGAFSSERKWFAIYTAPRHEKRIAQHLDMRSIEYYLPLYRTRRQWKDGSRVTLDLPLFPGYIFVHIDRRERTPVLQVPGVLWIVGGTGRQLTPLPDAEIEALRSGLHLRHAEPHPLLTSGQIVRIRSGAMAGVEGIVIRKKTGLRVVLTVNLIMQSVAVEVDEHDLELVNSGSLGQIKMSA
jgi:transcription antitermination factor NusG